MESILYIFGHLEFLYILEVTMSKWLKLHVIGLTSDAFSIQETNDA